MNRTFITSTMLLTPINVHRSSPVPACANIGKMLADENGIEKAMKYCHESRLYTQSFS